MSDLVWSDYFDNDREANTGCYGGNKAMTVHELIEKLQECDQPDAEVKIAGSGIDKIQVIDVWYSDLSGRVFVEVSK